MLATYQEVHKGILVWLPCPNKLRLVGRQEDANLMMFFVPSISGDTGAARVLHAFTAQVMEVSSLCTSQSCVAFHQDFLRFSVDFQQPLGPCQRASLKMLCFKQRTWIWGMLIYIDSHRHIYVQRTFRWVRPWFRDWASDLKACQRLSAYGSDG